MIIALVSLSMVALADPKLAVTIGKETNFYSYSFTWSQEAAAIPELDAMLRRKAKESGAGLVGEAEEAYRDAKANKELWYPETGYQLSWGFEAVGQTTALLSLAGDWYTYTGGAHGMFGATAILWDRRNKQEIEIGDLFDRVSEFVLMHPAMCAQLNEDRMENRGGKKKDTGYDSLDDAFNGCPQYDELTIWISDDDKDGRFDTINFAADPYVAGPYAEGSYQMVLPVSERLIAAMKPEYRDSFEVGQTQ